MSNGPFYVQCSSGNPDHIMEAVPGSELEAKCKERAKAGFVDALCLNAEECPDCVHDKQEQARRDADYLSLFGCPMADLDDRCEDDCACKDQGSILDSPYTDQVRYITAAA